MNNSSNCPPTSVRGKSKAASCQDTCFRVGRWFPPAFISAIVAWSYYAYVVNLCFGFLTSTATIVFYLIFYHFFFIVFVFVYYRTIFSDPKGVPDEFYPPADLIINYYSESDPTKRKRILSEFAKNLPVLQRNLDGSTRFCDKCQCCKPDRTHHCGVIGKCVLKMDHFCPWVNNTVGFSNYKLFMLFLFYAILYCLYVACTSAPYFVQIWTDKTYVGLLRDPPTTTSSSSNSTSTAGGDDVSSLIKFNVLFVFFVGLMFALSLFFLFFYHVYLTLTNQTTIESFHPPYFQNGPDRRGYRVSYAENWRQVFGHDPKQWFLPVCSSTVDGITFPCRVRAQARDLEAGARSDNRAQSTEQLISNQEQLINISDSSNLNQSGGNADPFTPIVPSNGLVGNGYGSANRD